jgi:RNA polymerase sigma factor (sigma-70 family)
MGSLFPIDTEVSLSRTFSRFREPLIRFFTRRTGDAVAAEDLAQEVLARAAAHPLDTQIEQPSAYIFTIASNLLRDEARRARGRIHVPLEEGHPELVEDFDAARVLIGKEMLNRVIAVLDEMNPRTREIFLLYRLEGMKQREIGARIGVSVSAVEKHIVKAMAHLARRGCRP